MFSSDAALLRGPGPLFRQRHQVMQEPQEILDSLNVRAAELMPSKGGTGMSLVRYGRESVPWRQGKLAKQMYLNILRES